MTEGTSIEYKLAMSAIKKNIFYALITISLFITQNSLIHSASAADAIVVPKQRVQVRVFVDMGITLPNGGKGDFVQAYGMRIEPDGSEKAVWRFPIGTISGLLVDTYYYEYLYFDDNVYLYFPNRDKQSPSLVLQLNRDTGAVVNKSEVSFFEAMALQRKIGHSWSKGIITPRPGLEESTYLSTRIKVP